MAQTSPFCSENDGLGFFFTQRFLWPHFWLECFWMATLLLNCRKSRTLWSAKLQTYVAMTSFILCCCPENEYFMSKGRHFSLLFTVCTQVFSCLAIIFHFWRIKQIKIAKVYKNLNLNYYYFTYLNKLVVQKKRMILFPCFCWTWTFLHQYICILLLF